MNGGCDRITITDPAHPLYGRSFGLVSVSNPRHGTGYACVDDSGRAVLRIPITATNLQPPSDLPTSKLSLAAIRDLLHLTCREESIRQPVAQPPFPPAPQPTPTPPRRPHRQPREGEP
jgi:hypothetical protein